MLVGLGSMLVGLGSILVGLGSMGSRPWQVIK